MNFDLDQATFKLERARIMPLRDAAGASVAVASGTVWLTEEGDSRDYELNAGDAMTLQASGLALVSALSDATLMILRPTGAQAQTGATSSARYPSADELEYYKRRASALRAHYIGAAFTRLGRAIARVPGWFAERTATLARSARQADCA